MREDAHYPRQDGKTPWSFTVGWHWISVKHVQNRWEARNTERKLCGSHRWDTTLVLLEFYPRAVEPVQGHCQLGSLTGAVAS